MTCIIGLIDNDGVWVGADKSSVSGYTINSTRLAKVFRKQDYVIAYTSSFRMGQLLQHMIELPSPPEEINVDFMVREFIEPIRKAFKDYGYSVIENNSETGGSFIVGVKNSLFHVCADYQVNQYNDDFICDGCGRDYALAAMEALSWHEPETRIRKSIEITAKFCTNVLQDCNILKV